MKFQNFEILYGAACEMLAAAGDNAVVANGVAKQKKVLLAQFAANFPRTLADAETHPGFDLLQFINMLLKFPETLKGQGEKLHTLIESIEGYNLEVPAELKRIAESMQEKPKSLSDREKEIADALRQSFPSDEKELESLPFPKKEVLDFLAAHPEATDGKRRQNSGNNSAENHLQTSDSQCPLLISIPARQADAESRGAFSQAGNRRTPWIFRRNSLRFSHGINIS